MKNLRTLLFCPALCVLCLILVSCSKDYTGKEKTHPVFVKASSAQNSGDYTTAAKLYEEFLLAAPKSAETHMRLATIYGDNLDAPVKAIYHYEKVIELRPDDTVNNDNIRSFVSVARKKLFDQLKVQYHDAQKENAMKTELEQTKKQLDAYKEYSAKLLNRYKACVERLRMYMRQGRQIQRNQGRKAVQKTPAAEKNPAGNSTASAGRKAEAKSTASAVKSASAAGNSKILGKHTVKKGESLHSISRKYYGSARYYKLIAQANKGKLPANLGVRIGQVLLIPRLPEKAKK